MTIQAKHMLDVQSHFCPSLFVIFVRACQSLSLEVSKELGLTKNGSGPYWDTASDDESERRLILILEQIVETESFAIERAFARSGIYTEISLDEAKHILARSSS